MSAFSQPVIIRPDQSVQPLQRVALTAASDQQINEDWLQRALFQAPESLPIKELDPHSGPLIQICRELPCESGYADILYITPSGQPVLAETKLWRNPGARREVVGQILDYAKQLTSWSYEELDRRASHASKEPTGHIWRTVHRHHPDVDESQFIDGINRSLRSGDFLLLIIGDGIRQGAESLVRFLEQYGNLRFGLALIEVALFPLPDGSTLMQPRVLAKTEILERTLVLGPEGPLSFEQLATVEETQETTSPAQRSWFQDFWSEYLARLDLADPSMLPREPAKSTNQYFPLPPNGSLVWLSAYIAQSTRSGGVYLRFSKAYDSATQVYERLMDEKQEIEAELGTPLTWEKSDRKLSIAAPRIHYTDLSQPDDRGRVVSSLAMSTSKMIATLKPRLERAIEELGQR